MPEAETIEPMNMNIGTDVSVKVATEDQYVSEIELNASQPPPVANSATSATSNSANAIGTPSDRIRRRPPNMPAPIAYCMG
jgi:hypothetical protein